MKAALQVLLFLGGNTKVRPPVSRHQFPEDPIFLSGGKHRGRLLSELVKEDPAYCRWILQHAEARACLAIHGFSRCLAEAVLDETARTHGVFTAKLADLGRHIPATAHHSGMSAFQLADCLQHELHVYKAVVHLPENLPINTFYLGV